MRLPPASPDPSPLLPAAVGLAAGLALWLAASLLSGRREPWDSGVYWLMAYPLALAAAGALAWWFPTRPWRWAGAVFLGQFIGMLVRNGELGSLWPLGLIVFAVLAMPAAVVAWLVGRYHLRRGPSE